MKITFTDGMVIGKEKQSFLADSSAQNLNTDSAALNTAFCFVFPSLADVHVHLREPGFSYKETIVSGTAAAARGGYGAVCAMPNLTPVPDSDEHLAVQENLIREGAKIDVYPYGAITVGEMGKELADMDTLASRVVAFSDDGRGVQDNEMMLAAMTKAKSLGKIIAAHCEVNALLHGGCIHDGAYAAANGLPGICSESEWGQIKRDLALAAKTGCAYHVCHISTKESVALIREAKSAGVDVTCETAPHYLLMHDGMLKDEGRFKMNPPLRSEADRDALLEGICDGTIDMIATDHAPHSAEEKAKGLRGSNMGIVGLETALPLLYTYLVKEGVITMEKLIALMSDNPRKRFGMKGGLTNGYFTVFDPRPTYEIDPATFVSMGRSTPFTGWKVSGITRLTAVDGKIAYSDGTILPQA